MKKIFVLSIIFLGIFSKTVNANETPANVSSTSTPTIFACSCPATVLAKSLGNANCDTFIDGVDFEIFRQELFNIRPRGNANFNCDTTNTVDNTDYQLWRNNRFITSLMKKFSNDEGVNINTVSVSGFEQKSWANSCLECN